MKNKTNIEKNHFWFLTNRQLVVVSIMLIAQICMSIGNIVATLKFIQVQKAVQDGHVFEYWNLFLALNLIIAILSAVIEVFVTGCELKINVWVRVNLFLKYRKIFQIHEKAVRLKMERIGRIFSMITTFITVVLNTYLVIKTSQLVEFSTKTFIGSLFILVTSVILGIFRGIKKADIDDMNSSIQSKEADLTKFYTFSEEHMKNSLGIIQHEYGKRNKYNIFSTVLAHLPAIIKEVVAIISVYGLIKVLVEGVIYSNAYIIISAYATTLIVAKGVSSIIEDTCSFIRISSKEELKILDAFEKKEKIVLSEAKKSITYNENTLIIHSNFTADVRQNDIIRYYSVRKLLSIKQGEKILLVGNKGTGKTRILQIIESVFEKNTIQYNDKTKVFYDFYSNFEKIGWDYQLIEELAEGLALNRFLMPEDELKKLIVSDINTGDSHLYVLLVMLYYAVKKSERAKLIILDEIFANIDPGNSEEILQFVLKKINSIGSSVIFVGHSQKELLLPYCDKQWVLKTNGSSVEISEK